MGVESVLIPGLSAVNLTLDYCRESGGATVPTKAKNSKRIPISR